MGTWSDDTSMILAELDSLAEKGGFDPDDVMERFCAWLYEGRYTPAGCAFGVGRTTQIALSRFRGGTPYDLCACEEMLSNGNGSLMRMLPYALLKEDNRFATADAAGMLTHAHPISRSYCALYMRLADALLDGHDIRTALSLAVTPLPEGIPPAHVSAILNLEVTPREEIPSSGFVGDTFMAAVWCLLHTDNYVDAVLTAVNLGDDADTVACVAGGLAGILYGLGGERGVPDCWTHALLRCEEIEKLCARCDAMMR